MARELQHAIWGALMSVYRHIAASEGAAPGRDRARRDYRLVDVDDAAGLDAFAPGWDALVAGAPNRVHTIAHAWISAFFEHCLGADARSRCLVALDGDAVVGVLPVVLTRKYGSVLTKSQVCPPVSPQTFAADLVCRSEDSDAIVDSLFAELDRLIPSAWELEFGHVSELSPVLAPTARAAYLSFVELDGFGRFVSTGGSFDAYLATLRPHFARNLRRVKRKFHRLDGAHIERHAGEGAREEHLDEFLALESSGWKGRRGTAIANDASLVAFYRDFTRRLRASGWLEWRVLRAEGRAIASQMTARIGSVLYLWKIAYDERYTAYAPGNLLMLDTIEDAFRSPDIDEVNCLTNSAWNEDWNMSVRRYYRVTVWPKRVLPFLAGYCRKRAKAAARRVPGVIRLRRAMRRSS
jgi:CelD/BcsL family acetyltransferase involved in cellulose biosynthesis